MGACFDISVSRPESLSVSASLIRGVAGCDAELVAGGLGVEAQAVSGMQVEAVRLHEPLDVACRIICSVSDLANWLRVTPEEVQWITDDMGVYFDVVSNVEWIVEID